jgi:SAM-dependent methyltransferase
MIKLYGRQGDPAPRVQAAIDGVLRARVAPRVLEAGCGSTSRVQLPPDRVLVGIDISERQLDRHPTLDERVLGDLQQHRWPPGSFDLIVCWDVVEHLPEPGRALQLMFESLRPGGAVVLAFPNLWSLKGLVTKLTPYGFHVWFYRHILGDRRPRNELDQFTTPFRAEVAPARIRRLARGHGLEPIYEEIYEGPVQTHMRRQSRLADIAFGALAVLSRLFSAGRLDLGLSDCVLVFRRSAQPAALLGEPVVGLR